MNKSIKLLRTGEYGLGCAGDILTTSGVGSCIVICLWDRVREIGAMAHIPHACDESRGADRNRNPGLSPDTAVPTLLRLMRRQGSSPEGLSAKLAGAGNMFQSLGPGPMTDMVGAILGSAHAALNLEGITVVAQSTGGEFGRTVSFDVETGQMNVISTNGDIQLL